MPDGAAVSKIRNYESFAYPCSDILRNKVFKTPHHLKLIVYYFSTMCFTGWPSLSWPLVFSEQEINVLRLAPCDVYFKGSQDL